jgi:hypothetical protein
LPERLHDSIVGNVVSRLDRIPFAATLSELEMAAHVGQCFLLSRSIGRDGKINETEARETRCKRKISALLCIAIFWRLNWMAGATKLNHQEMISIDSAP